MASVRLIITVAAIAATAAALPTGAAVPRGRAPQSAASRASAPLPRQPHVSLAAAPALEPGRWELRPRDGGAPEQLCLTDLDRLLRLRHEAVGGCEMFALKAPPGQVTVQYTCRGRGYGRSHVRFETARLIQFETQGVLDGIPFETTAEARRVGDCGA